MVSTISRRTVVLFAAVGAVFTFAACDSAGAVTQPDTVRKVQAKASHDGTDSTSCISGYLDATGHWVCP